MIMLTITIKVMMTNILIVLPGLSIKGVVARARLFTCLTKARCANHRQPKIYNLSLLVFLSSDFLLFENRSSCFFSFRICRKTCSCGSLCIFFFWLFLCLLYNQELFFSRPSKVEVVVKNELYHVKKNPFKCIKNNGPIHIRRRANRLNEQIVWRFVRLVWI